MPKDKPRSPRLVPPGLPARNPTGGGHMTTGHLPQSASRNQAGRHLAAVTAGFTGHGIATRLARIGDVPVLTIEEPPGGPDPMTVSIKPGSQRPRPAARMHLPDATLGVVPDQPGACVPAAFGPGAARGVGDSQQGFPHVGGPVGDASTPTSARPTSARWSPSARACPKAPTADATARPSPPAKPGSPPPARRRARLPDRERARHHARATRAHRSAFLSRITSGQRDRAGVEGPANPHRAIADGTATSRHDGYASRQHRHIALMPPSP